MINSAYKLEMAVLVLERMKANNGSTTQEFLSTHPSNDTRIANLTKWVPKTKSRS